MHRISLLVFRLYVYYMYIIYYTLKKISGRVTKRTDKLQCLQAGGDTIDPVAVDEPLRKVNTCLYITYIIYLVYMVYIYY